MNQSIATLIKLKLFHGGHPHNVDVVDEETGEKKERKHKSKHGRRNVSSPVRMSRTSHELHRLNSIGEEVKATPSSGDSSGEDIQENKPSHGKRQSKLRSLKNKITLSDLTFKSPSSSPQRPLPTVSARTTQVRSVTTPLELPSHPSSKSSLDYQRNSQEVRTVNRPPSNAESVGSVPSVKVFSSQVKNGNLNSTSTASSVRFSKANSRSNVTFPVNQLSKSETTTSFCHARSGSVEVKSTKVRSTPIGRRRSRTVDASDYIQTGKQSPQAASGSNDLISSISTHLRRSRSNSLASRSPIMRSQNSSHLQFSSITAAQGTALPTPPRLSAGSIPFPVPQNAGQPPISRRSSSIANAFSSLVNLRSSSASSMKGTSSKTITPKFDTTLRDLPTPPEPLQSESEKEFLVRLAPFGKFIAVILCEKNDPFKLQCMKSYLTNYFDFDYDPLDISMRKLLMFLELPKESQQIDRLLTIFAAVYYESQEAVEEICPWTNENQVYFASFSLLMLHTDYFNHHNRYKMTKSEFIELVHDDTESDGYKIPKPILAYYYDNTVAKESPKFDFSSAHQSLSTSDASVQDSTPSTQTLSVYSPIDIIQASESILYDDHIPVSTGFHGRVSSNSYSSYFPHIPTSTSSSSASVIQDDIDVYSHILEDSLAEIDMTPEVEKFWDDNCLLRTLTHDRNKYSKYFSILKEVKGGYIKVHKSDLSRIALTNFEILNETDDDYRYLKIVQMGEIYELTINKKFSIVGAVNKICWKKEYAILTSCGLLVFDNMDWINPTLVSDVQTNTSNYIIEYKPGASMIPASPINCNGLFAIRKEEEVTRSGCHQFQILDEDDNQPDLGGTATDNILYLHGSQKVFAWKCANQYERENWIDSINLMAAFDNCFYDQGCLLNSIVAMRKVSMEERTIRLETAMKEKARKLRELQGLLPFYRQAMPLCSKTRSELRGHIKQLAVKMDWLVYEIKRNEVYLAIIQKVKEHFKRFLSQRSEDDKLVSRNITSPINESFIFNEELYPAYLAEDSFASKESLTLDNTKFFSKEYDQISDQYA